MGIVLLLKSCSSFLMKAKIITILFAVCYSINTFSQNYNYTFIEAKVISPSSVEITLKTFADKKKTVDIEAKCAALRIVMFDGIEGTIYNKPLLNQGTSTIHDNPSYFEELFNYRLSDFIKSAKMLSGFKKAEKGEKSTIYNVEVNYIQLKKDLEKNKIKKQLGL